MSAALDFLFCPIHGIFAPANLPALAATLASIAQYFRWRR
jgi:hypothetical protein